MSNYDALADSYDTLMADGSYRKRADFLEKQFRKSFGFEGTPLRFILREKKKDEQ